MTRDPVALASVVLAVALCTAPVGAGLQTGPDLTRLEADVMTIAALPGEPSAKSAADLTPSGTPLLTIENSTPFDTSAKRRLVVVGGDIPGARAVLAAVRWFKTSAPAAVRQKWSLSVLPLANPDADGGPAMTPAGHLLRWVAFQAPDLVIVIRGDAEAGGLAAALAADNASGLGSVPVVSARAADGLQAIRKAVTATEGLTRSALHESLAGRVARDPLEIARVLARRYPQAPGISYIPAVAWINALRLASITGDDGLRAKVREQTQPWISGDRKVFGDQIPLTAIAGTMIFAELAKAGGGDAARALAIDGAERASLQKTGGIPQHGQGWTDDMFMATAILAATGTMPGRERDLETAARLVVDYASRLQRPDGIFVHAAGGPVAWGRGNGFAALGLMETLTALTSSPGAHPAHGRLLETCRRHMHGLSAMQAPDGMWRQVIDEPGSYRELTATAMILSAMARGVRLGWLDKASIPIVERAWRALAAHIAEDGALVDVCASTGAGPTKRYYLDRPAITGADDRGGAMALLASVEMYELSRWSGKSGRSGRSGRLRAKGASASLAEAR